MSSALCPECGTVLRETEFESGFCPLCERVRPLPEPTSETLPESNHSANEDGSKQESRLDRGAVVVIAVVMLIASILGIAKDPYDPMAYLGPPILGVVLVAMGAWLSAANAKHPRKVAKVAAVLSGVAFVAAPFATLITFLLNAEPPQQRPKPSFHVPDDGIIPGLIPSHVERKQNPKKREESGDKKLIQPEEP